MGKLTRENEHLKLYRPYHSQDTNYHIINESNGKEFLIDIEDVYDVSDLEEFDEVEGIMWEELIRLDNIEELTYVIWEVYDSKGKVEIIDREETYKYLEKSVDNISN